MTSPTPAYSKRLIEVDLPHPPHLRSCAAGEIHPARAHLHAPHLVGRRPLAACRAVLCPELWPDPVDEFCPRAFTLIAAERMWRWAREERARISAGNASIFKERRKTEKP